MNTNASENANYQHKRSINVNENIAAFIQRGYYCPMMTVTECISRERRADSDEMLQVVNCYYEIRCSGILGSRNLQTGFLGDLGFGSVPIFIL